MHDESNVPSQTKQAPRKAMQLGKPKKQNELMKTLQKENNFQKGQGIGEETKEELAQNEPVAFNPLLENVAIEIEEKVNCSINKDGDVEKFEVKGIIYLTINDPKKNNPLAQISFN